MVMTECNGARASQIVYFLKFQLTRFQLSEFDCITSCMDTIMYIQARVGALL